MDKYYPHSHSEPLIALRDYYIPYLFIIESNLVRDGIDHIICQLRHVPPTMAESDAANMHDL